jgi:hypothetical protein
MHFWKKTAATALGIALSACGGGDIGGDDEVGSTASPSAARFPTVNNNCAAGDIDVSLNYRPPTFVTVGESVRLAPVVRGIPDPCRPFVRFSLGGTGSIPGMVFDTATGVFSGTPTKGGYFLKTLRLTISGFSGYIDANATFLVEDPSQHSFLRWQKRATDLRFSEDTRLGSIGSKLYLLTPSVSGTQLATWASDDGGLTWRRVAGPGPTQRTGFAVESAGGTIYLAGGADVERNTLRDVWRFDGAVWTQVKRAAPFPARRDHNLTVHNGALYVIGGRRGTTILEDSWRSTDGGENWEPVWGGLQPYYSACAASAGTVMVRINGLPLDPYRVKGPGDHFSTNQVWYGLNDIEVRTIPSAYNAFSFAGPMACASFNNRVVYVGKTILPDARTAAMWTQDGTHWMFEASEGLAGDPIGAAVTMENRIYILTRNENGKLDVLRTR